MKKSKIKLSENLQMGITPPASQGTFFKVGGVIFLVSSALLAFHIYKELNKTQSLGSKTQNSITSQASNSAPQQVLGAFSNNSNQIQTVSYTVQPGDTLFDIAQNHGMSWQVIATLNNLNQPYSLKPGAQLKLPATIQGQ